MDDSRRDEWLAHARARWDARAAAWDSRSAENALAADREADLDRVWAALGLQPGAHLLDAGCGSGQFALALAARGARVTAVDLSPEMIRLGRGNAASRPELPVQWLVAPLDALPLETHSVDAVHARMVLPFVPDIPAALAEIGRVLRPGGRVLVSTAGAFSPVYRDAWRRHLPHAEPGCNFVLPWELEALLTGAGWMVLEGWGEWGAGRHGAPNPAAAGAQADHYLRQATATTWTIIATRG
ncbi:MAG: methyltransferase domain-containing protein [Thermomicrobiales bacterium]